MKKYYFVSYSYGNYIFNCLTDLHPLEYQYQQNKKSKDSFFTFSDRTRVISWQEITEQEYQEYWRKMI